MTTSLQVQLYFKFILRIRRSSRMPTFASNTDLIPSPSALRGPSHKP